MARTCPNCHLPTRSIKTIILKGKLVTGCDDCLNQAVRPNELAASHRRESQRKDFRREITQPFERDYFKAYPDAARERYGDDAMRKFG